MPYTLLPNPVEACRGPFLSRRYRRSSPRPPTVTSERNRLSCRSTFKRPRNILVRRKRPNTVTNDLTEMSDGASKPAIPAWQRAQQQPTPPPTTASKPEDDTSGAAAGAEDSTAHTHGGSDDDLSTEESIPPPDDTSQLELDQVRAFLDEPGVKDEALGKKRAFLESKGISTKVINQSLESSDNALKPTDFDTFRQQHSTSQNRPSVRQPQASTAPPIITYPEFLTEAHKPPPLVTPSRVLNATYFAGGLATLVYGASKYIINPKIDSLTESRHDFASHSQSKVDEFNDRLSKIVSRVPAPAKDTERVPQIEISEVDSITSDPTELFHRDMGTQTSPLPSRHSSETSLSTDDSERPGETRDPVNRQTRALDIIYSHLSELAEGASRTADANKQREESVDNLRHYLDTLLYASSGINVWTNTEEVNAAKPAAKKDPIEELKQEIRGVKGVLLSAKRFPSAAKVERIGGA